MNRPLVTIGISFYNPGNLLLDAVCSIFAQTYSNWELILIDDGSTDCSLQLAKSIVDSRVKVFSDGQNKKLPTRLNEIILYAKGKYIARMDADDLCGINRLEKQVAYLEKHPKIDLVGTGAVYLDSYDSVLGKKHTG